MYMNKLVIDSSAWIEYFSGTEKGKKVKELIGTNEIFTTSISIAEICSKFKRSKMNPTQAFEIILSNSKIIDTNKELSFNAGILHAEIRLSKPKFSLSDAYAVVAARGLNAKVVTSDYDFKGLKEAIFLD